MSPSSAAEIFAGTAKQERRTVKNKPALLNLSTLLQGWNSFKNLLTKSTTLQVTPT